MPIRYHDLKIPGIGKLLQSRRHYLVDDTLLEILGGIMKYGIITFSRY